MSLLVVGSVAFDSVKTPFGAVEEALGGSATFFSVAASYFTRVSLVAVVGEDFPEEHLTFLKGRGINIEGLERKPGRTFRWKGEYSYQLNEAKTLDTELNVFQSFHPNLPPLYRDASFVFLANIDPTLQMDVLKQVVNPQLVACDTMNFWIEGKLDNLIKTLASVDILLINDGEARELAQEVNLVKAAKKIISYGPRILVVKQGEYGALMFNGGGIFSAPAFPLEAVFDPTGAGDSFAGGFMGYLSKCGLVDDMTLRQAVIYGSTMASFNVEAFSLDRMRSLKQDEITSRYQAFKKLTHFENI